MMLVLRNGQLRNVFRIESEFGDEIYDLCNLTSRLLPAGIPEPLVESNVDSRRVGVASSPAHLAGQVGRDGEDSWLSRSSRTMAKVYACFLVAEDPQHRLDLRKAATLTHQVSLVEHVLSSEHLRKVLIGDEVGLGKTIEAGMILKRLIDSNPAFRALYLAPARLVSNVTRELREKLDLDARAWVAGFESDARIESDRLVIASIQKACFGANFELVANSGPWDAIVVDECHHLSDWSVEGGKPTRSYRLVSRLIKAQSQSARLILMSGTPHQGNEARFKNLLRLLSDDGKQFDQSAGRVIFRTKERVQDWKGDPLFPARQVREPILVEMGEDYRHWYRRIAALYEAAGFREGADSRAAGWAKGQALQWAASSLQAGIGFLARLGIRRLRWTLDEPVLRESLESIRPYRGGPSSEPVSMLFERMQRLLGARKADAPSLDDEEDGGETEGWKPDAEHLRSLLRDGIALMNSGADQAKWSNVFALLDAAGDEKVVLFAQPVETVTYLADLLLKRYGRPPAMIVGNQSDDMRSEMVRRFQEDRATRFLVSSRAGGEGLNMQRARRLIHLDIPWNPMEMEQRIGRVHRYGSRKTILVDTVVVTGTREVDMYREARRKLAEVARDMAPDQFQELFSRVMSLLPPRELEHILCSPMESAGLDDPAKQAVGRLVAEGFSSWRRFDETYRKEAERIRMADGGQATWADVQTFLTRYGGASAGDPASCGSFVFVDGEVIDVEEKVPTVQLEGRVYACGETGGLSAVCDDGSIAEPIGLNHEVLRSALFRGFSDADGAGAAYLHLPDDLPYLTEAGGHGPVTVHVLLRQALRADSGRWVEIGVSLHCFVHRERQEPVELTAAERALLVRAASNASRIREPRLIDSKMAVERERDLVRHLARRGADEAAGGVRYSVWPVAILILGSPAAVNAKPFAEAALTEVATVCSVT